MEPGPARRKVVSMLLDCTTCPGRGEACEGCVVTVLLDPTPAMPSDVSRAVGVLRRAGLIGPPHLALVSLPAGFDVAEPVRLRAV